MTIGASRRRIAAAAMICAAAFANPGERAQASPWNRPAGQGLVIYDYTMGSGNDYFDGRGRLAPARSYTKGEIAAYVEYGATDSLTLLARPSLDDVHVGAPEAGSYRGLGSTAVGAQWQALVFGPAVLAVQGSFSLPGSTSRANPALVGNTAREGELRLLGGIALPVAFRPFLDLQGSFRVRSGGAAAQWHGDATFGFYPLDRLLLLFQSFTVVPTGRGDASNPSSRATRLGVTGVYALSQSWALQVGVFTTDWGRDALHERGFTSGIWHYF